MNNVILFSSSTLTGMALANLVSRVAELGLFPPGLVTLIATVAAVGIVAATKVNPNIGAIIAFVVVFGALLGGI